MSTVQPSPPKPPSPPRPGFVISKLSTSGQNNSSSEQTRSTDSAQCQHYYYHHQHHYHRHHHKSNTIQPVQQQPSSHTQQLPMKIQNPSVPLSVPPNHETDLSAQPPPVGFNNPQVAAGSSGVYQPGLDFKSYLKGATGFYVRQKMELLELVAKMETENRYEVMDQFGNRIFWVRDARGANVLRFERPLNCSLCCGACLSDEMIIMTADGQRLGRVVEEFSCCLPMLGIEDSTGGVCLRIEGPCCPCSCCGSSVVFDILTMEGTKVGQISKLWRGFEAELTTDADNFSITFPQELNSSLKAVCLGALFLIDFEYFERSPASRNNQYYS